MTLKTKNFITPIVDELRQRQVNKLNHQVDAMLYLMERNREKIMWGQDYKSSAKEFARQHSNRDISIPIELAIEIHAKLKLQFDQQDKYKFDHPVPAKSCDGRICERGCGCGQIQIGVPRHLHEELMDQISENFAKTKEELHLSSKKTEELASENVTLKEMLEALGKKNEE